MVTLLVDDEDRDIEYWRCELSARITDFEMRVWPDVPDPGEIDVILADGSMKRNGGFGQFPNLGWVNYLGHGVGDVLRDPSLPPHVLVTRMKSEGIARSLTGYTVHAVMSHHLRQREYALQQGEAVWRRLAVPAPDEVRIAVLGLGVCGLRIARAFNHLGYRVRGWTRSPKASGEITSVSGREALEPLLAESDYVVGVLPETSATVGLINREILAAMKAGAYLVSAGRGSLVVEEDLLEALDSGHLSGAALDVFRTQPLPESHPFWAHPKIVVNPHSGGPDSGAWKEEFDEIAENHRLFRAGQPLLHLADRAKGY